MITAETSSPRSDLAPRRAGWRWLPASLHGRLMLLLVMLLVMCAGLTTVGTLVITRHFLGTAAAPPPLGKAYVISLSVWTLLGLGHLSAIFGVVLFARLTRPLRGLAKRMRAFHDGLGDGSEPRRAERLDEVTTLESTFDDLVERVQAQMAEIQRMVKQRQELIVNVSHDLRTPIATVRGYLETLALKSEVLTAEERDGYVQIALRQAERLGELINELFELTTLESNEVELSREVFCLSELVSDNVQRLRLGAHEKGVRVDINVEAETSFVEADIGLIERALENLLANAVHFTAAGGVVRVTVRAEGNRLAVEVADTGCGIAEEDLSHLFERYYRCRFPVDAPDSGSGLGLAITKRIVDLHGGTIEVRSAVGQGSTFTFRLAAAPDPSRGPREEASGRDVDANAAIAPRIRYAD